MGMNAFVRFALLGARGRMGCAVIEAASAREDLDLVRIFGRVHAGHEQTVSFARTGGQQKLVLEPLHEEALAGIDVLLDFSSESGLIEAARLCRKTGTRLVSGSTPVGTTGTRELDALAEVTALLHASNFSRGLAALAPLLPALRERLGPRFAAGVIDVHHRHKKDAPSGTARALAAAWSGSPEAPVPTSSLRVGEAVGDHALWIEGGGERIEIWHRAFDRSVFAEGALDAVHWIAGQKPGRYRLEDCYRSILS